MPIARQAKAPWVEVWESPQTIVIPGSVYPNSGPITWTIPWLSEVISNCLIPNLLQFLSSSTTWILDISSTILSISNELPLSVGTLWSGVAIFAFNLQGNKSFFVKPSNAWGEVTSWRYCLSI